VEERALLLKFMNNFFIERRHSTGMVKKKQFQASQNSSGSEPLRFQWNSFFCFFSFFGDLPGIVFFSPFQWARIPAASNPYKKNAIPGEKV
jgi:hypothetical protein